MTLGEVSVGIGRVLGLHDRGYQSAGKEMCQRISEHPTQLIGRTKQNFLAHPRLYIHKVKQNACESVVRFIRNMQPPAAPRAMK